MKTLLLLLLAILLLLQYKLWLAPDGARRIHVLKHAIAAQKESNESLRNQNLAMATEIDDLKHGKETVEEMARHDLGMTRPGEQYYRIASAESHQQH